METIELSAEQRARTGKEDTAKVRQAGLIPAILYGSEEPSAALSISDADLARILRKTGNHFVLLNLKIKGKDGEKAESAIIKAIQRHPVNEKIIHVDFYRVSLKKQVSIDVPVELKGEAPGIKLGGVLQQATRHVRVRCLPNQVPDAAIADISALNIGGVVHARDLALPEGVELQSDPAATILSIVTIKVEEEAAPAEGAAVVAEGAAAPEAAQPEVIGEKERDERRLKKGEEKVVKEAEKKEIKEALKTEGKKK
jgi:large subunit ribosomal protein L25